MAAAPRGREQEEAPAMRVAPRCFGCGHSPPPPGIRVEPKTYFANERTFLQWISPVSVLLSVAVAMVSFGDDLSEEANNFVPIGCGMMVLAGVWLFYALWIYWRRLGKIRRRDVSGWEETTGPLIMVVTLLLICVLALLFIVAAPWKDDGSIAEEDFGRPCETVLAGPQDFPGLSAEPSGLDVHPTRGSVFVASPYHVFEISPAGVTDYPFPGLDIEAVTFDVSRPNTLYLGVENPNSIVVLDTRTMSAVSEVDVKKAMGNDEQLEALAVCPPMLCGSWGRQVLVAGQSRTVRVLDLDAVSRSDMLQRVIDVDALLCRRIRRCTNRLGRITDLFVSDEGVRGKLYAIAGEANQLIVLPWNGQAESKFVDTADEPSIFDLPVETRGNWQGITVRKDGDKEIAIIANDYHGFVKEFHLTAQGFQKC